MLNQCVKCDNYYTRNKHTGSCIAHGCYVGFDKQIDCSEFKKRSVDIPQLLDDIARLFIAGATSVVLLADGAPMFTLEDTMSINEVEVVLRTYCKVGVRYTIVPNEGNQ